MKITFTKNYSSDAWIKSNEDLLPRLNPSICEIIEQKHPKCSEIYIMNVIRNYFGSVNSYKIIDIDRNEEDQIIKATFSIISFDHWDNTIDSALIIFNQEIQKIPQIILMNEDTIIKIEKLVAVQDKLFGSFESKNGLVRVCIDNSISNDDFCLVHDEQANITSG